MMSREDRARAESARASFREALDRREDRLHAAKFFVATTLLGVAAYVALMVVAATLTGRGAP